MILALALLLQHDPADELKSFKLLEGFEANLFASEKDGIANPVQIRWDERGRLWAICTWAYPQLKPGEKPNDKIIILEDTNGDGRADKSTVFADGLNMPMGLELGLGEVYVGVANELLVLKDVDGDDKADTRELLLSGFGTGDSHQNINSFRWGPGGELWFCQGMHAFSRVETPWGVEKLDSAGVWRLRPNRLRLDGFLHGAMGAHNPWGLDFDDWGQPLMAAGNGHGLYYMMPAAQRADRFLPFAAVWTKGRKFASCEFVGTAHLPPEEQGLFYSGGFMNNQVYRYAWTEDRSGFAAKELPPLLTSTHVAFRPVDVKVGPDGAVYVADWYNPIIGHYQASFRHPDRDVAHGRVWRISVKGRPLVKRPALEKMDGPALLAQLKSPERWNRYQAKRLLRDKPLSWQEEDERVLVDVLGAYESQDKVEPKLLERLLTAKDGRARAYATRVVSYWHDRLPNAAALLDRAIQDEHPRVRLEAVVACSYVPGTLDVLAKAVDRPMDAFLQYAFNQAVHLRRPEWEGWFARGVPAKRLEAVATAAGGAKILSALVRGGKTDAGLLTALAAVGTPEDRELVLEKATTAEPLEELARGGRPLGDLAAMKRHLENQPRAALALVAAWKLSAFKDEARKKALSPELRRAAFNALAALGDPLDDDGPYEILSDAAAALAPKSPEKAARLLSLPGDPTDVVRAYLARSGGAEALAAALKDVDKDAALLALRAMGAAGREDKPLWDILQKAAGISAGPVAYDVELVKALITEAKAQGDPAKGEQVFRGRLTNCLSCHAIGGAGGKVGPELGEVGTALPADLLIESVLWPNRQVKENFTATLVATTDGRILQGYKVREDKEVLVLRDPAADRSETLPIKKIERRKDIGSMMPEGIVRGLTRTELRDLIRFLMELGKGPYAVTHEQVIRAYEVKTPTGWVQKIALVSGLLPLDEIPMGEVRFKLDVPTGRKATLTLQGAESAAVEFGEGSHQVALKATGPLRVTVK
ncbi:MAG TPA: PVC-type heme-binding CxxCH protein [Planctomycetota bacterium]